MKLLGYGAPGAEKPGLLDDNGRVRDLSGVIGDVAGGPLRLDGIAKLQALDPASMSLVDGTLHHSSIHRVRTLARTMSQSDNSKLADGIGASRFGQARPLFVEQGQR